MAQIFRIIALVVALLAISVWIVTGAHRGFTKTSIAKTTVDEVTGLDGVTYEKKFVAGVDFLGAALLGAAALAGISYFLKSKPKSTV
jgi:hypothetical protein